MGVMTTAKTPRELLGVPAPVWGLSVGALGLLVCVSTSRMALGSDRIGFVDALGTAASDWLLWLPLVPPIVFLARRFRIERGSLVRSLAVHVPASVAASLVEVAAFATWSALVRELRFGEGELARELRSGFFFKFHTGFVVYWAFVLGFLAFDLGRRTKADALRRVELGLELSRARLELLQAHLAPHFLFNTLHFIGSTVRSDPAAAETMIAQLGDLLRSALEKREEALISLGEELELLETYLAIQATRFGDRLRVVVEVSPDALDACVPTFLLQPLAENAIRHGVGARTGDGRLDVRAVREGERVRVTLEDDGPGPGRTAAAPAQNGRGLGLANTRERLALAFGGTAGLSVGEREGGGTRVSIYLPCPEERP